MSRKGLSISLLSILLVACSSEKTYNVSDDSQSQPIGSFAILDPNFEQPVRRKPKIAQVEPEPIIVVKSKVSEKPKPSSHSISGQASWYCKTGVSICTRGYPGGLYAAIRRDLLYLRGRAIKVCYKTCISVRIIDCNCGRHANLIDLYSDAYRKLAPLGTGRIPVTIKW